MSELTAPRTPRPEHSMRRNDITPSASPTNSSKAISKSIVRRDSPVNDTGTMTPPPSTQLPKPSSRSGQTKSTVRREYLLASPPATLKSSPPISSGTLFGEIPSLESVQSMDEGQLRNLIGELLPALGEARVTVAHSKLQHSLLSIETEEAAKRAAVEHEATRREVQVLQEGSPVHRNSFSPKSPQASMQRNLQQALAHCRDLQQENSILDKRLRSSKKIISQLDEHNAELKENVHLLRQRIKENRDHLNEMQSTGAISINGTPVIGHSTPLYSRTPKTPITTSRLSRDSHHTAGTQDPFDALLLAGQVMNGEANSVPSSPSVIRAKKVHPHHVRGAHSLSSLPTTPNRSRPVTADNALLTPIHRHLVNQPFSSSTPGTKLMYHEEAHLREDRESTISASDNEDNHDEELPGSQASQMATDMLRRSLGAQNESSTASQVAPDSSKVMQAKLFGQVQKPGVGNVKSLKRAAKSSPYDESVRSSKKARMVGTGQERVGLGIQTLPSPGQ